MKNNLSVPSVASCSKTLIMRLLSVLSVSSCSKSFITRATRFTKKVAVKLNLSVSSVSSCSKTLIMRLLSVLSVSSCSKSFPSVPSCSKKSVTFANDSTDVVVGFVNDMQVGEDGWMMISPYGDFPGTAWTPQADGTMRPVPAIQRMDRQAATDMVNEFKSFTSRIKRFFGGRNIYLGHPDVAPVSHLYPDKSPKGVFVDLAARDDGFFGKPVFTNEGILLVEEKKVKALSGRWTSGTVPIAVENGKPVFRPDVFISAGLTNTPNIPVQMFNEAADAAAKKLEEQKKEQSIMKWIVAMRALLAGHGITLANDATEDQTIAAVEQLGEKAKQVVTLANEKTKLDTELTNARTSFANERKQHIATIVGQAIKTGRITEADRATWEGRLAIETNFANEAIAIEALKPVIKTASLTLEHGGRRVDIANTTDRTEFANGLIKEEMARNGGDYDAAWTTVQRTHPQVFEAMKQPKLGN